MVACFVYVRAFSTALSDSGGGRPTGHRTANAYKLSTCKIMRGRRWWLTVFSCHAFISSCNCGANLINGHREAGCLDGADGVASLVPGMVAAGAIVATWLNKRLTCMGVMAATRRRKGHDRTFLVTSVFFCGGMVRAGCCRASNGSIPVRI